MHLNGPSSCLESGLDVVAIGRWRAPTGGPTAPSSSPIRMMKLPSEVLLDARLVVAEFASASLTSSWLTLASSKSTVKVAPLLNSMPRLERRRYRPAR